MRSFTRLVAPAIRWISAAFLMIVSAVTGIAVEIKIVTW
jgi:hypothetical protein